MTIFLLSGLSFSSYAQRTSPDITEIFYERALSGGLILHTNGWGITMRHERHRTLKRQLIYEFDFLAKVKHPKELKIVNESNNKATPFVYGKINSLLTFHAGMGNSHMIADKEEPLSVRINLNYSVGPVVGFIKPVYLEIQTKDPDTDKFEDKITRYDPEIHPKERVVGGSGFWYGIENTEFMFGAYGKGGISFDWASKDKDIKKLEAGFIVDAFPRQVPIMGTIENKKVFLNLYLSLTFGSRW